MSFSQLWQTVPAVCQRRACRGVIHISCEYWAVNRKRCFACCVCISVDKYCKTLIINRQLSHVMVEKYVYKAGIKVLSEHCGGDACEQCACLLRGRGNVRVAAASFARFQKKASLHCEQGLFVLQRSLLYLANKASFCGRKARETGVYVYNCG